LEFHAIEFLPVIIYKSVDRVVQSEIFMKPVNESLSVVTSKNPVNIGEYIFELLSLIRLRNYINCLWANFDVEPFMASEEYPEIIFIELA